MHDNSELESYNLGRAQLLGSLLLFTKVFYRLVNKRPFVISQAESQESHNIIICRELTKIFYGETMSLMINVPPGFGKSTHLSYFTAWAMAHYPDSSFLYISYAHEIASKHTAMIKTIMSQPEYREWFGVEIRRDSSAKDNFRTNHGGNIAAFGSNGAVTGNDGGLPNLDRFSGGVFIDDIHKPNEVHSDTVREAVKTNYNATIKTRVRGPNVPIVCIGQRLHEDDVPQNLINGYDGRKWKTVILPARDVAGNILAPNLTTKDFLDNEERVSPYVYSSQYLQNPLPAGGGIFRRDDFILLWEEPKMLCTFITADTAETEKTYNDATVFSFWGLYKIEQMGFESEVYGLHWIDCVELRVEPKDLETEFVSFYTGCMRYPLAPQLIAIEKKSTGVTLVSVMKEKIRGLRMMEIERSKASGSKTDRFLNCQRYVGSRQISLPAHGKHTEMVLNHMNKITANDTHRFDDICDTFADAVKIALIDKILQNLVVSGTKTDSIVQNLAQNFANQQQLRKNVYGHDFRRQNH